MYYLTPETIMEAYKGLSTLDSKIGGLFCVLSCLPDDIEENKSYVIDGNQLRKQLSFVFDKVPKKSFDNVKPSYIIFAIDWYNTFFNKVIKTKIDLLLCAVFFLRRYGFENEVTNEEIIETFIRIYKLKNFKEDWFTQNNSIQITFNQRNVEDNQTNFYKLAEYDNDFKSLLFNGVIQKSASDIKAAGQIQTLYSGSVVQSCFLLSNEPMDHYYLMHGGTRGEKKEDKKTFNTINFTTGYSTTFSRNRILFGAPGTGKSFTINKDRIDLLGEDNEDDYERVTFHPDYSYANFVGTYKPVMIESLIENASEDEKEVISVLTDRTKTAQEKYDLLYDQFKEEGLTRLPLLLGLYTDETFKTRKADGSDAVGDNSVERNHGRAIRPYVNLSNLSKKKDISYEYVPGPFMRVYVKALKNSMTENVKPFLLIIEEINRANVAAVFGDIFQLLDRGNNGTSEYSIQASEDIKKYLAAELNVNPSEVSKIRIPDNMFIWATMNSADQGVFPMDTAFKRRWDFKYIGINHNDSKIDDAYLICERAGYKVKWNQLRRAINDTLSSNSYKINEDKLMGPFFVSKAVLADAENFREVFKSKVIMYLFEDAAKQRRSLLFDGCDENTKTKYSTICEDFDKRGIDIFCKDVRDKVEKISLVGNELEGVDNE